MGEDCIVCFEKIEKLTDAKILTCGHYFHLDCWTNYLFDGNDSKRFTDTWRKCPLCRQLSRQKRRKKGSSKNVKGVKVYQTKLAQFQNNDGERVVKNVLRTDKFMIFNV